MLSSVQGCPCDPSRILSLEEEGFGFAVLEAEDLAIATHVDFALSKGASVSIGSEVDQHESKTR